VLIVLPEILIFFFTTSNLELLRDKNSASGGEAAKKFRYEERRVYFNRVNLLVAGRQRSRNRTNARHKHKQRSPLLALPDCLLHLPSACIRDLLLGNLQHQTAHTRQSTEERSVSITIAVRREGSSETGRQGKAGRRTYSRGQHAHRAHFNQTVAPV